MGGTAHAHWAQEGHPRAVRASEELLVQISHWASDSCRALERRGKKVQEDKRWMCGHAPQRCRAQWIWKLKTALLRGPSGIMWDMLRDSHDASDDGTEEPIVGAMQAKIVYKKFE